MVVVDEHGDNGLYLLRWVIQYPVGRYHFMDDVVTVSYVVHSLQCVNPYLQALIYLIKFIQEELPQKALIHHLYTYVHCVQLLYTFHCPLMGAGSQGIVGEVVLTYQCQYFVDKTFE